MNKNEKLQKLLKRRYLIELVPISKKDGAGVLPEVWGKQLKGYFTVYAGGLGLDNLKSELDKIEHSVCAGEIWIDMETNVRSYSVENGDYFDLEKCEDVLKLVKKLKYIW